MEISTVLYYQLNIDYIVENYCVNKERPALKCDGKCYLSKQLQTIDASDNSKNKEGLAVFESFIPLFYQENIPITILITLYTYKKNHNWSFKESVQQNVIFEIDHPPRFV